MTWRQSSAAADDLHGLSAHQLALDPAVQADPAVLDRVETAEPGRHVGVRGHGRRVDLAGDVGSTHNMVAGTVTMVAVGMSSILTCRVRRR